MAPAAAVMSRWIHGLEKPLSTVRQQAAQAEKHMGALDSCATRLFQTLVRAMDTVARPADEKGLFP